MITNGVKLWRALLATLFFVVVLLGFYYVHIRYFRVDVVFYDALKDVLMAVSVSVLLLLISPYFSSFGFVEKFQMLIIWLLLGYIYAISVPTVIDRSLSFYILEKLQQRGGAIRLERFEDIFTKEYVKEYHLVAVRLTEQKESGTVTISNDCVRLTQRGQYLASFSLYFRKHFLPKHRLLMGEYTDVLTDPFPSSKDGINDSCR